MYLDLERVITRQFKQKAKVGWTIDYEYKSKVLKTNARELLNNLSYNIINGCSQEFVNSSLDYIYSQYNIFQLKESLRIHHANIKRVSRLRKRIKKICKERAYFLTLTFTDEVLDSTSEKTRRAYVRRALSNISSDYVANIDYGSLNEREHYHAVVRACYLDYNFWEYGIMYAEVIRADENSNKLLAKYVSKLTNHAIKETTKRHALIYSRKKQKSLSV